VFVLFLLNKKGNIHISPITTSAIGNIDVKAKVDASIILVATAVCLLGQNDPTYGNMVYTLSNKLEFLVEGDGFRY
jgi:hypothetical protein